MSEYAYWIDPEGRISKPKNRHIASVLEDPRFFKETKESVEITFKKHNEPISNTVEGKAREEVLLRVIKKGYARIRLNRTRNNQGWSIQVSRLTPKMEDALFIWANIATKSKTFAGKYADVVVHELDRGSGSGKMTRTTLDVVASGAGIREQVSKSLIDQDIDVLLENTIVYEDSDLHNLSDWREYLHYMMPRKYITDDAWMCIMEYTLK